MTRTKRPARKEAPITDPEIAAYIARNPVPLFRQFCSHKHRSRHAGERTFRAHDRNL